MNPIFSIIIPAYNAEKTIERTLNSVLKQKFNNYEVIVVENGSIDNTSEIVDKYISDYVHLIHSKKGVSCARNRGIDFASGEWILFLDADDELNCDALTVFENYLNKDEVDIIVAQYEGTPKEKNYFITDKDEYLARCLNDPTQKCNVTAVLFRRSMINDNNIYFNENLTHAEDSLFFINAVMCADKIMEIKNGIYKVNYVVNSAVRSSNLKQFDKYIPTIEEIFKIEGLSSFVLDELPAFILNQVLIVLVNNVFTAQSEYSFFELIKAEKNILNNEIVKKSIKDLTYKYCDKKRKILFKLMKYHCYWLLGVICKLKNMMNQRKGNYS